MKRKAYRGRSVPSATEQRTRNEVRSAVRIRSYSLPIGADHPRLRRAHPSPDLALRAAAGCHGTVCAYSADMNDGVSSTKNSSGSMGNITCTVRPGWSSSMVSTAWLMLSARTSTLSGAASSFTSMKTLITRSDLHMRLYLSASTSQHRTQPGRTRRDRCSPG
jgi:hypothetical protein